MSHNPQVRIDLHSLHNSVQEASGQLRWARSGWTIVNSDLFLVFCIVLELSVSFNKNVAPSQTEKDEEINCPAVLKRQRLIFEIENISKYPWPY